jgi:hypothetical protein
MSRPTYLPEHYKVEVLLPATASTTLDTLYQDGWRVISMAPQPDGNLVIFLLEKVSPTA